MYPQFLGKGSLGGITPKRRERLKKLCSEDIGPLRKHIAKIWQKRFLSDEKTEKRQTEQNGSRNEKRCVLLTSVDHSS